MSMALLKRSLAIVESDLPSKAKKGVKSEDKLNKSKPITHSRKASLKRRNQFPTIKKTTTKLSIKEIKANAKKNDKTEENIAKLLKFSKCSGKIEEETTKQIIKRVRAGHYIIPEEEKKEETSIFTEEDFQAFEKEYFAS